MRSVLKYSETDQNGSVRLRFGCRYFFNLLMFSTVARITQVYDGEDRGKTEHGVGRNKGNNSDESLKCATFYGM